MAEFEPRVGSWLLGLLRGGSGGSRSAATVCTAIRSPLEFDGDQPEGQQSQLFAAEEHGSNTMHAVRTFVIAMLMATTGWTSSHGAERVDLLLVLAADISAQRG
jgi:hypothetical protein